MDRILKYFLTYGGYDGGFAFLGKSVKNINDADLIIFTGGEDISPELYNQKANTHTRGVNIKRDRHEVAIFNLYKDIPKLGVCRGHQLISVLEGASLIQHVDGHHTNHNMKTFDDHTIGVTSCHHQMVIFDKDMEEGKDYYHLGWSSPAKATMYVGEKGIDIYRDGVKLANRYFEESEMAFFPKSNSLTVQFHPEWMDNMLGQKYVKELVFKLVSDKLEEYIIQSKLNAEYGEEFNSYF